MAGDFVPGISPLMAVMTHRFIVDPLDGTTNFLHGIPHFSISIALEREGEIVAGLVYNPINDEMFFAEKDKGAFLNDGRLGGADRRLRPTKRDIFTWVAAGRYDGFWERDLQLWDIAAGVFICQQAGLEVESLTSGNVLETCDPIVTNEALMPYLRKRVE